jgi:NAD(P)-dependent dehydrogenase (short-subunit alcohol dehydrogenase family)
VAGAGEHERRVGHRRRKTPDQLERGATGPFAAALRGIGHDDYGGPECRRDIARAGQSDVESLDWPRLLDVEGLARRNRTAPIDEPDLARALQPGERSARAVVAPTSPAPMMATVSIAALLYTSRSAVSDQGSRAIIDGQDMAAHLKSKTAVVTGGSRGIGLAAALLDQGANVAISGLNGEHLESARRTLARHEHRLETVRADVRQRADVDRMIGGVVNRFGGVDILVNNAGIGAFANVADMSDAEWHRVIATNLTGVFYCCHAAIPHMRQRGGNWIINISSLAGKNSFVGGGAYCASKAGLNAFSESLMQEVRHDGIRVSYVMPGSVATEFSRGGSSGADWKLTSADVAQVVMDLLAHPDRSLPSRVELRPSRPPRK